MKGTINFLIKNRTKRFKSSFNKFDEIQDILIKWNSFHSLGSKCFAGPYLNHFQISLIDCQYKPFAYLLSVIIVIQMIIGSRARQTDLVAPFLILTESGPATPDWQWIWVSRLFTKRWNKQFTKGQSVCWIEYEKVNDILYEFVQHWIPRQRDIIIMGFKPK